MKSAVSGVKKSRQAGTTGRLLSATLASAGAIVLVFVAFGVGDLYAFELPYLWQMLGTGGVALAGCLLSILMLFVADHLRVALSGRRPPVTLVRVCYLLSSTVLLVWLATWTLMEYPITVRIQDRLRAPAHTQAIRDRISANDFHGVQQLIAPHQLAGDALKIMAERIAVNRPGFYHEGQIGAVIRSNADRYQVEPIILFYWLFLSSFYGEAVSGPLPFAAQMTSETLRDLVQAHLPAWFVESPIRKHLIESAVLEHIAGPKIGWKLRYALHKATLDLSMDPYNANVFSDVFFTMSAYEREFEEFLIAPAKDDLTAALQEAYTELKISLGRSVCTRRHPDITEQKLPANAYKKFARAAFLKSYFDFDFSTQVQALLLKRIDQDLRHSQANTIWANLSKPQRASIFAIARDVFVPNVGKPDAVPYLLPELNCAPREYLHTEIAAAGSEAFSDARSWTPRHPEYLWAGTGYLARLLNEVWIAAYGKNIGDLKATDAAEDAIRVIARSRML